MTHHDALSILKTGANVFLTGEPGSGKTHTVLQFITWLREHSVEPAITASTGIAATHIGGYTIHSWSGIGIEQDLSEELLDRIGQKAHVVRRIRKASVLIIDEISMLSTGTFEMIEAVCRYVRRDERAFGGLQVVLAGDFFQLPPVYRAQSYRSVQNPSMLFDIGDEEDTHAFAFKSPVWKRLNLLVCYMDEQYRQEENGDFYKLLTAIRSGSVTKEHEELLTARRGPAPDNVPVLFPHVSAVDKANATALGKISSKPRTFTMDKNGPDVLANALARGCLSPEELVLKEGATVMFTKNNTSAGFVNGTLGTVEAFTHESPIVRTRDGKVIIVSPMDWVIEENGVVKASVTQMPLRLAWAITVHKSQGMSLDAAHIDLSSAFEYGQGYVALSRVRSLEGLTIGGFNKRSLEVHPIVSEYDLSLRESSCAAQEHFCDMPEGEIDTLQKAFLKAVGGTFATVAIKQKKKNYKKKSTNTTTRGVTLAPGALNKKRKI